jgi:ABC-type branched-subunit amino acid transport system ATPase component
VTVAAQAPPQSTPVLSARGITVQFGGLRALSNVSLSVPPNTIVGLVGPNGAGKSTMFGVLSGLLRPVEGQVLMSERDMTSSPPQARARLGMARTFQQPELFLGLTVREHLVLGHRVRFTPKRLWQDMLWPSSLTRASKEEDQAVDDLLELLELGPAASAPVASLPLGISRLVEVGRALATRPQVLLLDEPLSGLDSLAAENLVGVFRRVVTDTAEPVSLLLVEHDVAAVMSLSSTIYVLNFGELIAEGSPDEIRSNAAVQAAYLGDAADAGRTHHDRKQPS